MSAIRASVAVVVFSVSLLGGVHDPRVSQQRGVFFGRISDAATGRGIEGAAVVLPDLELGSQTDAEGRFMVLGVPQLDDGTELVIRHPCFHTVRVELRHVRTDVPFEVGLPFRQPVAEDATVPPYVCSAYDPRG